jgi:ketosteroid isomerase-like protein
MMQRAVAIYVILALALIGCGPAAAPPSPPAELQTAADHYALQQIEANFHKAASTKDVDLMVSLFADTATVTIGGDQTYTGKDEIRKFFATKAGPFQPQNNWISETPAYKIRTTVSGDKGTLYFECHYVDVASRTVVSVVGAEQNVARINGQWLITTLTASSLPELTP